VHEIKIGSSFFYYSQSLLGWEFFNLTIPLTIPVLRKYYIAYTHIDKAPYKASDKASYKATYSAAYLHHRTTIADYIQNTSNNSLIHRI